MKLPWARPRWRITIEQGRIRAVVLRQRRSVWTSDRAYSELGTVPDIVSDLVAEADQDRPPHTAEILLAPPVLQRRTLVDLPPVRRGALRALVAHQASRFFRQNGHPLITDVVWLPRIKGKPRLATAVAVDEKLLTDVVSKAERAGLRVESVRPTGLRNLSLLPPGVRHSRERRQQRAIHRLAWVVVIFWICVGTGAVWRFERERRRVNAELARLADPLAALLEARQAMGRARAMLDTVAASDRARTRIPLRLRSLTQSLPDSAFLTSVTLELSGSGQISGTARRALDVVARLERNPDFAGPHLQGGTIQEDVGGQAWERFTIVFGAAAR